MACVVVDPLTASFGICPSRVGLREETALSSWRPRFGNLLGGRPLPVHCASSPLTAWTRCLLSRLATSQHLDRPRIASRLGVGLVAGRSVGAAVTWTNRVS